MCGGGYCHSEVHTQCDHFVSLLLDIRRLLTVTHCTVGHSAACVHFFERGGGGG